MEYCELYYDFYPEERDRDDPEALDPVSEQWTREAGAMDYPEYAEWLREEWENS